MQVTDSQVAALRAVLLHDAEHTVALTAELGEAGMAGYQCLADAALSVAAGQRFAPRYTSADLVRFIAKTRTGRLADGEEYDFDPVAGENVLRFALGQRLPRTADATERFRAVLVLVEKLSDSQGRGAGYVDDLLAQARVLADQWLASGNNGKHDHAGDR